MQVDIAEQRGGELRCPRGRQLHSELEPVVPRSLLRIAARCVGCVLEMAAYRVISPSAPTSNIGWGHPEGGLCPGPGIYRSGR